MKPLLYNCMRPDIGQRVYIVGSHPWSDCAGYYLGLQYNEDLQRKGARIQLDIGIEVMVWQPWQLRKLHNDTT